MNRKRPRFAPAFSLVNETLESRIALSGVAAASAEVAANSGHVASTETTLAVSTGTLGQPVTITATVRAAATAGAPSGTVNILYHGTVIQTLTLSPTASTNAKYAYSTGTVTLTQTPGTGALFFGKHTLSAQFVPSGNFAKSSGNKTVTVSQPAYTSLASGVKIATVTPGSGPQIQSGQTANVLYTGYLRNGKIFDESALHGETPISFTLGTGSVIPGFDAGITGMQVGQTRIIEIPPAQGYGSKTNGSIPRNSTLIFEVTLTSIS